MKTKLRTLLYITLGSVTCPLHAAGAFYVNAAGTGNFFKVPSAVTASFFTNDAVQAVAQKVESRAGYAFAAGYAFCPNFRTDVTVNFLSHIPYSVMDDGFETGQSHFNSIITTFNGYLSVPVAAHEKLAPYLMGGLGAAANRTRKLFWPLAVQTESGRSITQLAWQAGLGLFYSVTQSFGVDLGYRAFSLGDVANTGQFDATASNGVGTVGEPTRLHHLFDNQIYFGLHYRFS